MNMAQTLTEKEYNFKARIKVIHRGYKDWDNKNQEDDMVLLIPDRNETQSGLFFSAWAPVLEKENFEIMMQLGVPDMPDAAYSRGSVRIPNKDCDKHHIFVMSQYAEEILKRKNGERISVRVFPEDAAESYESV